MWPTSYTIWYLLLGLLPFFFLTYTFLRYGHQDLLSLRTIVIFLIWIGYHLSPWIAYLQNGDWHNNRLLVPQYIDTALLFSDLSIFAILSGYSLAFRKKDAVIRKKFPIVWMVPNIRWTWVIISAFILLMLTIYTVGGFSDFWMASYSRGEDQWAEQTWDVRLNHMLKILVAPLTILVILLACFHILKKPTSFSRLMIGIIGIIIACLPKMHHFSRMAGFPLYILVVMTLRYSKVKFFTLFPLAFLIILATYMGNLGYEERNNYHPGIGGYLQAALDSILVDQSKVRYATTSKTIDANINTLDCVAPFTRKVESQKAFGDEPGLIYMPILLFHINPIPSGIVNPGSIGMSLTEYMGTTGHAGLATPALAELYYALGYLSLLFLVLLGVVFGYFDRYAVYRPGPVSQLAILLMVIGTGISLHGGIRAWTRPILYAFIITILATKFFNRRSPFKFISGFSANK